MVALFEGFGHLKPVAGKRAADLHRGETPQAGILWLGRIASGRRETPQADLHRVETLQAGILWSGRIASGRRETPQAGIL